MHMQHRHIDENGEGRMVEILAAPIFDDQGEVQQIVETSRDITARIRAEEEKTELIERLQQTLNRVQTLEGLLPICAKCKKIRDDRGYWQQIEYYIESRSEAKFSHGMCNECMQEHHPGAYKQIIKKRDKD